MILTDLRKRMEHDVDEVSNIAKNIKDQLEALDREVSFIRYLLFKNFLPSYARLYACWTIDLLFPWN